MKVLSSIVFNLFFLLFVAPAPAAETVDSAKFPDAKITIKNLIASQTLDDVYMALAQFAQGPLTELEFAIQKYEDQLKTVAPDYGQDLRYEIEELRLIPLPQSQLSLALLRALEQDPVTSSWSSTDKSRLYSHVIVSGQSWMDIETLLRMNRILSQDPYLSPAAKDILSKMLPLVLLKRVWEEFLFDYRPVFSGDHESLFAEYGGLEQLEQKELELFNSAVSQGLIPQPSGLELVRSVDDVLHNNWHEVYFAQVAQDRPLYAHIFLAVSTTFAQARAAKHQVDQDRLYSQGQQLLEIQNQMYSISRTLSLVNSLSYFTKSSWFQFYSRKAKKNIMWAGYGDIYQSKSTPENEIELRPRMKACQDLF